MAHKKYTLLPAQKALSKEAAEKLRIHGACMLVSPPGAGKTRMSGYAYRKLAVKYDALVFHVAPTGAQAVAQAKEVGSFLDRPFGAAQKKKLSEELEAQGESEGYGATVVTTTLQGMQNLLKAAVEAQDKAEVFATKPENVPALSKVSLLWEVIATAEAAGVAAVVLSFDEVHAVYRTARATVPKNMAKLRDMLKLCFPRLHLHVLGITATPLFNVDGANPQILKNANLMFGAKEKPVVVECTQEQAASIMAKLKPHVPEMEHAELKLTTPICKTWDMHDEVDEIRDMLVEQACAEKVPIDSRMQLKAGLAKILAKQAAHAARGIFSKLPGEKVGVKVKAADGTSKDDTRVQNAILACDNTFNAAAIEELTDGLRGDGDDGMRKCEIVDLRSTDPAALQKQLDTFKKATGDAESGNVLGLISMPQTQGTNDFATGVGGVIAVGNGFDSQKRKQFEGRIDRPGAYEEGDVMYKKAKVIHVSSEWVSKVDSFSRISVPKRTTAFEKSEVGVKLNEIFDAKVDKMSGEGLSRDDAEDQVMDSKEFNTTFNTAYRLWKIGPEFVMHDDDDKAARSRLALAYLEKRFAPVSEEQEGAEEDGEDGEDGGELDVDKKDEDSAPDSDDDAAPGDAHKKAA